MRTETSTTKEWQWAEQPLCSHHAAPGAVVALLLVLNLCRLVAVTVPLIAGLRWALGGNERAQSRPDPCAGCEADAS